MDIDTKYNIVKAFHLIFFTTWMAGLFYLPRIFVYHTETKTNTKQYKTFIIMERKLYKYIMNPSLIGTWFFGIYLTVLTEAHLYVWFNIKFLCVLLLTIFHVYCGIVKREFEKGNNTKTSTYFRVINEVPTISFILIIYLVIFKPGI